MSKLFPVVETRGNGRAAGESYGMQARDRVALSIKNYAATFAWCGLDWNEVKRRAARFETIIGDCEGALVDEMRGIAQGANVDANDIFALNCRTELLPRTFGQPLRRGAREARQRALERNAIRGLFHPNGLDSPAGPTPNESMMNECTAIAVGASASGDGKTRLAQTWDWLGWQRDAMIVLRADTFVTLTEAGMLAKIGVNQAGLAVGLNILKSTDEHDEAIGLPVHISLRHLLMKHHEIPTAQIWHSFPILKSSSNIIAADKTGSVASFELSPRGIAKISDENGIVVHTNHFLDAACSAFEGNASASVSSQPRLECMRQRVAQWRAQNIKPNREQLEDALIFADGTGKTIARTPDLTLPPELRTETVAALIIECDAQTMQIAPMVPSTGSFQQLIQLKP